MEKHIIDFCWYQEKPVLALESRGKVDLINPAGWKFNWSFTGKRICPGMYSCKELKYSKCSDKFDLTGTKYHRCRKCEDKIGFRSVFFFNSDIVTPAVKEYLSKKHYVYLAYFAPSVIKVGTTSKSRGFDRLYAQDAKYFCFFASASGFDIQRIERYVSKNFGFPESVSLNHKLKYLGFAVSQAETRKLLIQAFTKIEAGLKDTEFADWLFEKPRFGELKYNTAEMSTQQDFSRVELLKNPAKLGGKVVAVRGRLIIIENNGYLFAVDGKSLIGEIVCDTDEEVKLKSSKEQVGLF